MKLLSSLLLGLVALPVSAQAPLTLATLIEGAQRQSVAAQQAVTARETATWQWQRTRADFRPQLSLVGTLPDFSRAIAPVTQPDGTTDFRAVQLNNSTLQLAVSQNIGFTGGQVTVASGMQRFDNFIGGQRLYNAQPFAVGFSQPLRGFNALAWARRTEPLRYAEAERQLPFDRETIAQRVTEAFFDVLLQQQQAALATQNERLATELLRLGREKLALGRVAEADVLLLELNQIRAQQARQQAELAAQTAALTLQITAGLPPDQPLPLAVPEPAPTPAVPPETALAEARRRRPETIGFQRRLLEADRGVAQARFSGGLQATLTANLGYINRAESLWSSYLNPQDQQQLRLAFALPIIDWGRQRAAVKLAEAARQLTRRTVSQDEATFEQQVLTLAAQTPTLHAQVQLAARADSLAQRRYVITQEVYRVGRLSLTDLGIAQQEKDAARQAYVLALRAAWVAHYRLRALTLYDFVRREGV
ncbi:MAG: TolC family protein [Hymenobacteraceae bacterium]|nr:TolC family protein [Hymenobacteraceae bacterium]